MDIINGMGRSRRKHGYEYEDEPQREYGRSRGREKSGAGTVIIIVAVVFVMLVAAFLYLRKDNALDFLLAKTSEASESTASVNESTAEPAPTGEYMETDASIVAYADETTTAEKQNIVIEVPTTEPETEAETEPETLPPPKYTENENTRLIERFKITETLVPETKALNKASEETEAPNETDSVKTDLSDGHDELKDAVTISFAGDILFDDHYAIMASAISRTGGKPTVDVMFDEATLSYMRDSDIFMLNNEFPYSDGGKPLTGKKYTFRAKPAYAPLLHDIGADIVALANNHLYDHGEEAFLDTLTTLKNADVPYVGAGVNIDEAAMPFYFTTGEIKIGFVAATQIERMGNPDTKGATETTPGVFRCLDYKKLCEVITHMRDECDFIIAYLHWGTESTTNIDDYQKKLAIAVRDAGCDLIIGDHPHVLQGISALDPLKEGGVKVPCIYSLGNYLFNSNSQDTCIVTAYIDPETAELLAFRFVPARQEGCKTHLLTGTEKERVLKHMRTISKAEIDEEGFVVIR